jgi:hypothetical protein
MRNPNWSALLGSLLAIFLPAQSPSQPPISSPPFNPDINWTDVFARVPPPARRPPGGSRGPGDEIIPLAPGAIGRPEIWSNWPLFLWQGTIRQLEIIQSATGELIWSQRIAATDRACFYTGTPLQSGAYEWVLYNVAKVAIIRVPFRVMSPKQQHPIAADLAALEAQLETQLETQPALVSAEQRALYRANYFAERQLWSDVFREAFAVEHPSEQLVMALRTLTDRLSKTGPVN